MLYSLTPAAICWGVLGIIRLHATISPGDIISKSNAFVYASIDSQKECKEVLYSAIRAKIPNSNDLNPFIHIPFILRRHALDFMEYIIDEANKIVIG